ncbi:hypothetical protein BSPWISOXPB_9936 [uncultured Gammaproteobacteria bacterium]|nr:hypothetical protein BSPWISOXPB_9936 [uncultured Gammaproteobacteria bacterium]
MVIFIFIVINQFVVYLLRVDYLCKGLLQRIHLAIGYMTPAQKIAELKKVEMCLS